MSVGLGGEACSCSVLGYKLSALIGGGAQSLLWQVWPPVRAQLLPWASLPHQAGAVPVPAPGSALRSSRAIFSHVISASKVIYSAGKYMTWAPRASLSVMYL